MVSFVCVMNDSYSLCSIIINFHAFLHFFFHLSRLFIRLFRPHVRITIAEWSTVSSFQVTQKEHNPPKCKKNTYKKLFIHIWKDRNPRVRTMIYIDNFAWHLRTPTHYMEWWRGWDKTGTTITRPIFIHCEIVMKKKDDSILCSIN